MPEDKTSKQLDLLVTGLSLGVSMYLTYKILQKTGVVKTKVTVSIRGKTLQLSPSELEILQTCAVDPSEITTAWSDIGGLVSVKQTLYRSLVLPFEHPELFPPGSLRQPPKGILLYGPPGTGKTLLARALAKRANAFFMEVRAEGLFSKWVGESELNCAALFSLARLCQPTILFVDEMDALLSDRMEGHASGGNAVYGNTKTIFLRHWDGFVGSDARVVVIGATNLPQVLDPAVLRRMPIQVPVGLPELSDREGILNVLLRGENTTKLNLQSLAEEMYGFSGADMKACAVEACSNMIAEKLESGQFSKLVLEESNFKKALETVRKSKSHQRQTFSTF